MDSTTHTTTTVEFVDWRTKAKEKLEAEDKLFKGGRAAASVQSYVEPKSKECPFCGASTYEVMSGTGVKCIRCTNKRTCGAIVSFSNKDCNERGVSPVKYFNRRAGKE